MGPDAETSAALGDVIVFAPWVVPVVLLAVFFAWETWRPFFGRREERLRHAGRNLAVGAINAAVIGLAFGALTVGVAEWTARRGLGLLHLVSLPGPVGMVAALVLLDGWMYVWHRLNHRVPLLWRFHRMHHSDAQMDVTTAARFHIGELSISATLRFGVIVVLGIDLIALLVYDTVMVAIVQLQHADVDVGRRADRWLRTVFVTPRMHKVHHSIWRPETDSNYSTVLSVWDRIARTFRLREDPRTLTLGLEELRDRRWQTFAGLWRTPFIGAPRAGTQGGAERDGPGAEAAGPLREAHGNRREALSRG